MTFSQMTDFQVMLQGMAELSPDGVKVTDPARFRKSGVEPLIHAAIFAEDAEVREAARWIVWEAAHELGVVVASINDLYFARGRDEYKDVCVPAVNIRGLTYDTARALIRAVKGMNGGPFLFEIAKSEMGYTFQKPAEYVTSLLGAAIREGYVGPLCVQGDHFQANPKNFAGDPAKETASLKALIDDALAAGFYNIDIDSSTLVDLSKSTLAEQQKWNYELAAELCAYIREKEPSGVTVSVGGEIGEVGGHNSNVDELTAYLDGFNRTLEKIRPGAKGLSKISVQTGTSHGGVVLPDGTIAKVALDFDVLVNLGELSRKRYGLSGAVQHGASTLPDSAFHRFKETQTAEVHLATGFQNLVLDHAAFPEDLRQRITAWLRVNCAKERKAGQTDEQFIYSTRKKCFGPFKRDMWTMPAANLWSIMASLEVKFAFLFSQLGLANTADLARRFIRQERVRRPIPAGLKELLNNPNSFGQSRGPAEDLPGAD